MLDSSRNNLDPNTSSLCNHTPTQPLKTQPTQSHLSLLDPRNLINMLQTDLANMSQAGIARRRTNGRRFS